MFALLAVESAGTGFLHSCGRRRQASTLVNGHGATSPSYGRRPRLFDEAGVEGLRPQHGVRPKPGARRFHPSGVETTVREPRDSIAGETDASGDFRGGIPVLGGCGVRSGLARVPDW